MSDEDSDMGELVIDEKLNFTSCPVRFNGIIDKEAIEDFIGKIESFKNSHKIPEDTALKDLSLLFEGPASSWWNEIKYAVQTWDDAITLIRYVYGPTKPPHLIYAEIFAKKQEEMTTEEFVNSKKKLFLQLPKPHPENVQIDMIYWMLKSSITTKLPRDCIDTLDHLVQRANIVERDLPSPGNGRKKRKRCGFCRINGHVTEECRKRQKKVAEMEANLQKTEPIEFKIKEEKQDLAGV